MDTFGVVNADQHDTGLCPNGLLVNTQVPDTRITGVDEVNDKR